MKRFSRRAPFAAAALLIILCAGVLMLALRREGMRAVAPPPLPTVEDTASSAAGSGGGSPAPIVVSVAESAPSPPSWRDAGPRHLPQGTPESVGLDGATLAKIDPFVDQQIADGYFPGAVVLVARRGVVVKQTAYGNAAVYAAEGERLPAPIPTRPDTIFDLASLTKLFTATAAMVLVDEGKLDLDAPAARYLPEFGANGKDHVTVRQLLTHTAGLPPGLQLWTRGGNPEARLRSAYAITLESPPGEKYVYSDGGPIIVGKVVERITGQTLDQFLEQTVLRPLGLADTMYNPPDSLLWRIAPTEILKGKTSVLWGQVHDGEARALSGVAGNAGLFGTASDLAVFAEMMLEGGAYGGARVLSPAAVAETLRPELPLQPDHGIGWELDQSWYMGTLASPTTFGHTGFSGTSLVVSPQEQTIVVVLANRLHPHEAPSTNATRVGVANLVHEAIRKQQALK